MNTRSKNKRGIVSNKKKTVRGESTSARSVYVLNDDMEETKKIEDLKLVASLVDWSNYDRLMGRVFYEKFGRILEQKVDAFQQDKRELKACVRENYENQRAMQTPKKAKPVTALLEQISKFRALNFDSDDDAEESASAIVIDETPVVQKTPKTPAQTNKFPQFVIDETPIREQSVSTANTMIRMEEPTVAEMPASDVEKTFDIIKTIDAVNEGEFQAPVPSTPSTPLVSGLDNTKRLKIGTPIGANVAAFKPIQTSSSLKKLAITRAMIANSQKQPTQLPPILNLSPKNSAVCPSVNTPSKPMLNTTFQKEQKLKVLDEKALHAKKARDEQLKEKAERAKKDREERAKRVQQNNKQKEQERLEREEATRKQMEAIKQFQLMNKQQSSAKHQKMLSPIARQPPLSAAKKTPVAAAALTPIKFVEADFVNEKENLHEISAHEPSIDADYNVDDLCSGDDTDNEEQPRKTIPKWAQSDQIVERIQKLHQLLTKDRIERHFGRIKQPTIGDLFKGYTKLFPPRRESSAVWDSPMSDPTPGVGLYQIQFNVSSTSKQKE